MRGQRFTARRPEPVFSEAQARAAWLVLLDRTRELAKRVRDGATIGKLEGVPFARLVIEHRAPFPLKFASAQNAAEAFTVLLRGFVASGWQPTCVDFLLAGAACLETLLIADSHARAEFGRRMIGERD